MNEENFIKCDFCKLRANVNMQKVWIKFNIDKGFEYSKDKKFDSSDFIDDMTENENLHLCEQDYEKWTHGEI